MESKKGRLVKKIINLILNVLITFFCLILIISIYNNLQVTLLKNSYASFFGFSIFEVQTGSMEPAIKAGDCVVVKRANEFNLNDIVTFEQNGEFITHRVMEAYKGTYVTMGDANNTKDDPISREQIVGKVIKIFPKVGILRNTLLNPAVLIALIITCYLISLVLKDRKRKIFKEKEVSEMSFMKIIEKIKSLFNKKKKTEVALESKAILDSRIEKIETHIPSEEIEIEEPANTKIAIEEEKVTETIEETPYKDDDLDKTMYFRMISVDEEEPVINEYIKDEEEKEPTPKKEKKPKKEETTTKEETKNSNDFITKELETLQKKRKKFKNIIERVMFIKEEELLKIVDIILQDEKNKTSMATIKTTLIKSYIDAKYYNYCGNINVEYNKKNMTTKINSAIKDKKEEMIKLYKGSDKKYSEKVGRVAEIISLILNLETDFLVKEGIRVKRENYKSRLLKLKENPLYEGPILNAMVNDILNVQKLHSSMVKASIDKLDTNTFKLVINPSVKNISLVYLEHNVTFSKVYSDYIVDKTYQEGVVAEDKIAVLITLLGSVILNDMMSQNFNQKYVLYIPESLYAKSNKLSALFDKFEDEYAKLCTVILVQYEELSKNSKVIKGLIKEGYKFAVDMSKTDKIKVKDMGVMELMSYIFIDKKTKEKKAMLSVLSKEASARVVVDDIETKIGSFWG